MRKRIWKEFYEYLTYDYYGRRRWRPAAYGLLAAVAVILGMMLAAGIFALQAPPAAPQPVPTFAPPTATAIAARIATATASAPPTPTPAPLCPDDPRLWQLVEMRPFLDPQTEQPVQMLKPTYRIEPPCVYQGLWRDVAHYLFMSDPPTPTVKKWVRDVPWYWSPEPDFVYRDFFAYRPTAQSYYYDREGWRIDEVITPFTAVWTGDPDYPVLVYLYRDFADAAYGIHWKDGRIEGVWPVILHGGQVMRRVDEVLYDAQGKRWVTGDYRAIYVRMFHTVPEDGSWMWETYGIRGFRRSELAEVFGMKEILPERINPKEWTLGKPMKVGP
ncbi:MAG: hypothetical protein RMM10_11785 [Anaerolineae bacterium]|uniref:hypothetical protein n=2 Tax=Thermoflexus sp. TaxID=1969742 RepID=UPI0025D0BB0B|nr:hypothetical protein [Thermoflexus sp.]MCS7352178.1 hypothetical protein [Thermoflexus sp.]MDW8181639.1 hypothetical protein [Anaerolineae bacterium]